MNHGSQFVRLLALCFFLASTAHSQQPKRIKVVFVCGCEDQTGKLYAMAFRDLLASSPRFVQTSDSAETDSNGKVIAVNWKVGRFIA